MPRLPIVSGDLDEWGTILNSYLREEHEADGTHGTITPTTLVIPSSTLAGLPAAGTAGRLARVTDVRRGVSRDTGVVWAGFDGEVLNVLDWVTAGAGTAANPYTGWDSAISALTTGSTVLFPPAHYRHTSPISITSDNIALVALAPNQRWRSANRPVRISYVGTDAAVKVVPGAGVVRESIVLKGLHWDGSGSTGAVDGLELDGSAGGGAAIEGVLLEDTTFSDFPQFQIFATGTVFDVTFRRLSAHNSGQAADDLIRFASGGTYSQVTCDDCFLLPHTVGKYAFNAQAAITSLRFLGGTVSNQAASTGAHGIFAQGSLFLYGTHVEGIAGHTSRGVVYSGTNGAFISPAACTLWGTGVHIGNPDNAAANALGAVLSGNIGNNTTDILISAGGSRQGTVILQGGYATGSGPVISNLRESVDGVFVDVIRPTQFAKAITATATLDFDLSASASQDLTISVTGAALGDTVAIGVPNGSVTADTLFWGWVSAGGVVTIRAMRTAGTPNPASGTFRVTVYKNVG